LTDKVFVHSGDIGDIIYGLPTIKALGGGHLRLIHTPGKTAHGMTETKAERLATLLRVQPYIHSCEFSTGSGTSIDGFRHHGAHGNLADMHLATHGLLWEHRRKAWLQVEKPFSPYEVIVHRSARYHGRFPWRAMLDEYKDRIGFVGFPDEHEAFTAEFGEIPFVDAPDYLSLAKVIAGAKLFAGNQSSPMAVAQGLKQNTLLEICPGGAQQHCVFQRLGCVIVWDHKVEWPEINSL